MYVPCLIADASDEDVKSSEGASSRVVPTKTKDAAQRVQVLCTVIEFVTYINP